MAVVFFLFMVDLCLCSGSVSVWWISISVVVLCRSGGSLYWLVCFFVVDLCLGGGGSTTTKRHKIDTDFDLSGQTAENKCVYLCVCEVMRLATCYTNRDT